MSAGGSQSRKFNPSSAALSLSSFSFPFIHTHSLLFDALQLVNVESELGRLPIRGPTCACAPTRLLVPPLRLPRCPARSIIRLLFRFSACPLVIMAFRTPSDARLARSLPPLRSFARSLALILSFPMAMSAMGLAIRSIRCSEMLSVRQAIPWPILGNP